ncbi:MAG: 4-hydroxy-tetrahydrodipicolinate reductase [Bacteroidetes bacterium HGW-Bacteroidetes-1]|nr:MAG: 4-hydroxy-tetrahydrodipicolinate reductase [Bacteroidetes bacterium HGW-Bacteroidetes-1]
MNVALLGYGKMGKVIEQVCLERGHRIACVIDSIHDFELKAAQLEKADIAIDFSLPETAFDNILRCFELSLPVVVGTTGWYNHYDEVKKLCLHKSLALFHAPNFSLGMNIVFRLNKQLAKLVNGTHYRLSLHETHHTQKLDAPSGTALRLAEDMIERVGDLKSWRIGNSEQEDVLPIDVSRIGDVSGIHEVIADSAEDTISLKHEAKGRKGFAVGAVLAAEFLFGKKGVFMMDDILNDKY